MDRKEKNWPSEHDNPDYWKIVNLEEANNNPSITDKLKNAYKIANERYEASRERLKTFQRLGLMPKERKIKIEDRQRKISISRKLGRVLPDRQILFDQQNGLCNLCKLPLKSALTGVTIDHILPRSKGGGNEITNKQLTHSICNNIKGDSTEYISPARYQDLTIEWKIKIRAKRKRKLQSKPK